MIDDRVTVDVTDEHLRAARDGSPPEVWALAIGWFRTAPDRVGELILIDAERVIGRGAARADDPAPRALPVLQRPDRTVSTEPIEAPRISRTQLRVTPSPDGLHVESIGRCPMFVSGRPERSATVAAGATVRLGDEIVFLVVRRPMWLPPARNLAAEPGFAFGAADPDGIVGEGPAAWRLRDELAFAARSNAHILVRGETGVGKELCAAAIHRMSSRASRPMISRNAATFPEGIIDAELFGNVRNYPNPGTSEREGLIGIADGGTVFLDEIGELPLHLQAHLLRVLDAHGQYQRLGDPRVRTADVRFIAATNREEGEIKHDFAARLTLHIDVPSLGARREDLPLLVRHTLARLGERLAAGPIRIDAVLADRLLRHGYAGNMRELERILLRALGDRDSETLTVGAGVLKLLGDGDPEPARAPVLAEPDRDALVAALAHADGSVTRAAKALGLRNRNVLYRLMKRHGIAND